MKIATVNIDIAAHSLVNLRLHQAPDYSGHRSLTRGLNQLTEWYVIFNQSSISRLQFATARIQNHEVES